ncbi:hypothetical protein KIL84_016987 [Mauremys mutica]|uniref:Uncharacterized protein n=1 Tax=Mauremys mutica TaxID=74926 RepID=A0A9D3X5G0_9SAUR|nr:hypothetical protein KIL84_016987 [Mauremys mutica]
MSGGSGSASCTLPGACRNALQGEEALGGIGEPREGHRPQKAKKEGLLQHSSRCLLARPQWLLHSTWARSVPSSGSRYQAALLGLTVARLPPLLAELCPQGTM